MVLHGCACAVIEKNGIEEFVLAADRKLARSVKIKPEMGEK